MDDQIPEKTKKRVFTVSWIKKARIFRKKMISARTQLQMSNWIGPRDLTAHSLLSTISHVIKARDLENGGFFFTAGPRHK